MNKENNNVLVSAIITTHNRLELLKRAIQSVYNQTYSNIELIVVDDASDDGTKEWAEQQSFKFIYIPKEKSKGGNYARNLGIKSSHGKYVAFLDDDDYWLPHKILKQLNLIIDKNCELVFGGRTLELIDSNGKISYKNLLPNPRHCGDMSKKILRTICCTTTTIFAKREALFDIGLFDENLKFWQEYELIIRLAQRAPFFFVNESLAVYRVDCNDSNRLTNKYYSWKNAVKYIHTKHQQLYSKLNFWERLGVKILIWRDAKTRAKSSGLKFHYYRLYIMCFLSKFYNLINILITGDFKRIKNKFTK